MFCWNGCACGGVEPTVKQRFARGVVGFVGLLVLVAGCASATSARSGLSAPPASSAISSPSTAPVASVGATCGSVGTNDFSAATVLFQADADAVPCLARAMTTCRPASLDISQIGVDAGVDYLLTITGPATNGCKARLAVTTFVAPVPSPEPTPVTAECTARMQDTDVLIVCPDRIYLLPPSVASPQPTLPESSPPASTPPPMPLPSTPSPRPGRSSIFTQQPSEGPSGYPTGDNAQVVAVAADAAGQPLITLLIPNMYCSAMFFDIPAIPAPNGRPCVVTFDAGTGQVGPADATSTDAAATCPAWPTPHVTFIVDQPPTAGCTTDPTPVAGLYPGAIGWLVEGGGVPYFVLANGTEFHPPARHIAAHLTPSVAPTP